MNQSARNEFPRVNELNVDVPFFGDVPIARDKRELTMYFNGGTAYRAVDVVELGFDLANGPLYAILLGRKKKVVNSIFKVGGPVFLNGCNHSNVPPDRFYDITTSGTTQFGLARFPVWDPSIDDVFNRWLTNYLEQSGATIYLDFRRFGRRRMSDGNAGVDGVPDAATHDDVWADGRLEGELVLRYQQHRQREAALRDEKIRRASNLLCEVCGLDLRRRFGRSATTVAEVHHLKPLAEMPGPRQTTLDDLAIVCPTCHRYIHSIVPAITLVDARVIVMKHASMTEANG